MPDSRKISLRAVLWGVPVAFVLAIPSPAQDPGLMFDQVVGQPHGLPQLPAEGTWGEVINVTTRWIVIQNQSRQQFPIRVDNLGDFLVRWPITIDRLGAQSVVESVGRDAGSNVLQTQHIDVFEGADRTLVSPSFNNILPSGGGGGIAAGDPNMAVWLSGWGLSGFGWMYPQPYSFAPGAIGAPSVRHVVGTVYSREPLQLQVPGNNFVALVPPDEGAFTMTQVTRGAQAYVRKGDHAFLMPMEITPKGLILSQFVLYKTTPLREFNAARR
jgi:hypothetical protein